MISHLEIIERLLVAAAFGSIIGFERERLLWAAGIRTHMLVSVGACLIMIVSAYGFQHILQQDHIILDPSRVAAQVVSGIGFLGAGSIMLRGQVVRGLTSAASIWTVAAIGLAAGGGLYFAAAISTVIILVILAGLKPIEEAYHARIQSCRITVKVEKDSVGPDELTRALKVRKAQIKRIMMRGLDDECDEITIHLVRVSKEEISQSRRRLEDEPGVRDVSIQTQGKRQID